MKCLTRISHQVACCFRKLYCHSLAGIYGLIFLLLIANAAGQAGTQPEAPKAGAAPATRQVQPAGPPTQTPARGEAELAGTSPDAIAETGSPTQAHAHGEERIDSPGVHPTTPQQPVSPPENAYCPQCDRAEQLVVDLVYYKQILDILGAIDQQREQLNPGLLRAAHAELVKVRPDLAALLKPEKAPAPRPAPPPEKPAKKPIKPAPKPKPRQQGIDGLTVGHVNGENRELGIKASVVLVSNGRPRSLNLDGVIEHNRRKFRIVKVDYVEDPRTGNRHEVHLQDQASKQVYVVPWQ